MIFLKVKYTYSKNQVGQKNISISILNKQTNKYVDNKKYFFVKGVEDENSYLLDASRLYLYDLGCNMDLIGQGELVNFGSFGMMVVYSGDVVKNDTLGIKSLRNLMKGMK
jgi:hypothetical protein